MTPSVSISVPIGAYHPLLRDCLASLAAQSPRPLIAVLDASADPRTAAVIDEFSGALAYRRTGKDGGQSDAILEGWEKAPGDVLGWLNADDALFPGALARVTAHFRDHPDTDVLYGHTVIINDDFDTTGYHWAVEPPSEAILSGCIISQPSCFFRREAYGSAGGLDAALHYTMDWDLWTRLWTSGAKFRFEDTVWSRVLWTREAKTGGFGPERRKELGRIIDKYNSPSRRVKSRIGFGLHHLLEYSAPGWAAGLARASRGAGVKFIHGVGRTGEIAEGAELPLANWAADAAGALVVELEGTGAAEIEAKDTRAAAGPGRCEIAVATAPGETLWVKFHPAQGAKLRLKALRLG